MFDLLQHKEALAVTAALSMLTEGSRLRSYMTGIVYPDMIV
jgi:hypothetical protein